MSVAKSDTPNRFRHNGFGNWIIGYQGFIERILRASLSLKLAEGGWKPCDSGTVSKSDLTKLSTRLEGPEPIGNLTSAEKASFSEAVRPRSRLQLDLAFTRDSEILIGEIKSWGGWGDFDLKMATSNFSTGRDAWLFMLDHVSSFAVCGVTLVVWGVRGDYHDGITEWLQERYGAKVQIEYADELLRDYRPDPEIIECLVRLEETHEDIKAWLTTGTG